MSGNFSVPEGAAGERLDVFLAQSLGVSRSRAGRLIHDGAVSVNARPQRASYPVHLDDTVSVAQAPAEQPNPAAPELPVVYEDAAMLVVDKPAGLTVHPGAGRSAEATVADYARSRTADPDPARPGIVHRLDRDTSGLLVLAKTAAAKAALQQQFRDRNVRKTYLALVVGHLKPPEAVINLGVGRHPTRRLQQTVTSAGRAAVTNYSTLENFPGYSLIEAHPATGRTHQIRVHLAAVGHPVAGDTTYGAKRRPLALKRQFLHASALELTSLSGQPLKLTSPLPPDLAHTLATLKNQV